VDIGKALGVTAVLAALASIFTLGSEFENTISTGQIVIAILMGAATITGVIWGVRYKVSYEAASAAAKELRQSISDGHEREHQLKVALASSHETNAQQRQQLEKMKQLPDMSAIVQTIGEMSVRQDASSARRQEETLKTFVKELSGHEQRAIARHDLQLQVLQKIADTLDNPKG